MATIEIHESAVQEKILYFCVNCGFDMTVLGHCIKCREYKTAVTLEEYMQIHGCYPRLKAVK